MEILRLSVIGYTEVMIMAYHVAYGPPIPERYQKKRYNPLRLQVMTAVCLLVFVLLVKAWFPVGTQKLQQLLLPGAPSVTQQALDELVTNIRSGDPLNAAFTAFCQHIIDHDEAISH